MRARNEEKGQKPTGSKGGGIGWGVKGGHRKVERQAEET